jgi:hypothetical protein
MIRRTHLMKADEIRESALCKYAYLVENAGIEAPIRFAALSALFDAETIRHVKSRGIGKGWQCPR